MKQLYITWWSNGESYEDYQEVLVGVFESLEKAKEAAVNYDNNQDTRYGGLWVETLELNQIATKYNGDGHWAKWLCYWHKESRTWRE
jgi:hypothetical protein